LSISKSQSQLMAVNDSSCKINYYFSSIIFFNLSAL